MKTIIGILFYVLVLLIRMCQTCSFNETTKEIEKEYNIRPIKITVTDYDTGGPLRGMLVLYRLEETIVKDCIENTLPLGGPLTEGNDYDKKEFTNERGEAFFHITTKRYKKNNRYHEYIHINIESNEPLGFTSTSELKLKNKSYFGFYISNYEVCMHDLTHWDHQAYKYIDVLINTGSLEKNNENITIKLKKISKKHSEGTRYEIKCNN